MTFNQYKTANHKRRYTDQSKMEYVVPLKTKRDIKRVQKALLMQGRFNPKQSAISPVGRRNLMMFDFGVSTGLRVSDIIKLKVSDVKGDFLIREKKTGKPSQAAITDELHEELNVYITEMHLTDDDWLFPAVHCNKSGHISRSQAYRAIKHAGDSCGIPNLGSHTMRKTFGRMWYEQGMSLPMLQEIFNHSSQKVTLHYIGIDRADIKKTMRKFHPLS